MNNIQKIAKLLTEDPDIFNKKENLVKQLKKTGPRITRTVKVESKKKKPIIVEENKPSKKPKEDEFEKEFRDMLGLEHKPEPADPSKKDRNQKSPNNKLDGAKQTGSAYLK